MAGVGEAASIVGLIATAAQLSKSVYDIAGKYSNARREISSFGQDVGSLGQILDQFDRMFSKGSSTQDSGVQSVTSSIVNQCRELLGELEKFRDALYSTSDQARTVGLRGRLRWMFQASELQYLQTRVDSMKINILLMMTLHSGQAQNEPNPQQRVAENDKQVRNLAADSSAYVLRLQRLEEQLLDSSAEGSDAARKRMSINVVPIAGPIQSTRESILSLYGREEYRDVIWDHREADVRLEHATSADLARASVMIDEFLVTEGNVDDDHSNNSSGYLVQNVELPASTGLEEYDPQPRRPRDGPGEMRQTSFPEWDDDAIEPTVRRLPTNVVRVIYHGGQSIVLNVEDCVTAKDITVNVLRMLRISEYQSLFYCFYTLKDADEDSVYTQRLSDSELVRVCKDHTRNDRNYVILAKRYLGVDGDDLYRASVIRQEQEDYYDTDAPAEGYPPYFEGIFERPRRAPPSPAGISLTPRWATVSRYYFESDDHWYIIECTMENGRNWELSRFYTDFYEMQVALLEQFTEESGLTGAPRTLPLMPGPVVRVTEAVARQRRETLNAYIEKLIALPPHISKCSLIQQFFAPREGDIESTPERELIRHL